MCQRRLNIYRWLISNLWYSFLTLWVMVLQIYTIIRNLVYQQFVSEFVCGKDFSQALTFPFSFSSSRHHSILVRSAILDSAYKWNHLVFVSQCLLNSLSIMFSSSFLVLQVMYFLFRDQIIFCFTHFPSHSIC